MVRNTLVLCYTLALFGPALSLQASDSWSVKDVTASPPRDDGSRAFSLILHESHSEEAATAIDLAMVADLSAPQAGPSFQRTVRAVSSIVQGLSGGSRVYLLRASASVRTEPVPPAAVGSDRLNDAVKQMTEDSPRGVCDLGQIRRRLVAWLNDRSGSLEKRILFIGSFDRSLGMNTPAEWKTFERALQQNQTSASWIFTSSAPSGPLAQLCSVSGGAVRSSTDEPATLDHWAKHLQHPRYADLIVAAAGDRTEAISFAPSVHDSSISVLVVGTSPTPTVSLRIQGKKNGEPFQIVRDVDLSGAKDDKDLWTFAEGTAWWAALADPLPPVANSESLKRSLTSTAERVVRSSSGELARDDLGWARALAPAASDKETPNPPKAEASIEDARARQSILHQQATVMVQQSLEQARKDLRQDPTAALARLKLALQSVDSQPLDPDVKKKLRSRIERELRAASIERTRRAEVDRSKDQALAASDARRAESLRQAAVEDRRKAALEQLRAMTAEGETQAVRALAEQQAQQDPSDLASQGFEWEATLRDRYARVEEIEWRKQRGFWDALATVEFSSVPVPDNREIVFPSAREWEEKTARRAKYKDNPTLRTMSDSEEKIRKALTRSVTIDLKETPLQQVVDFLKEFTGTNVVLDLAGLDEAGVDADEPITLSLSDVPLRSALRLLLEPLELSYVIRDDVLKITSQASADQQLETRVYYVADLVIPIGNFNGGGVGMNGQVTGGQNQTNPGAGNPGLGNGGGNFGAPGGGGAFRNDLSDELKRLIQSTIDRNTGADARQAWDEHFAQRAVPEPVLWKVINALARSSNPEQVVPVLWAARRHQLVAPTSFDAELRTIPLSPREPSEIEELALSIVAFAPDRTESWLRAAAGLVAAGQPGLAAEILQQQQAMSRPSADILLALLDASTESREVDRACWAAQRLLEQDWVDRTRNVHDETKGRLARYEQVLRTNNDTAAADRVRELTRTAVARDLVIVAQWEGEADIDLSVIEPSDFLCASAVPQTVSGGVLQTDRPERLEEYTARLAIDGTYQIRVERVWGMPTSGIVNVDVIWHQGTPQEKRERRTFSLESEPWATTEVAMSDGRRKEWSLPAEIPAVVRVLSEPGPKAELRRLMNAGGIDAGAANAASSGSGASVPFVLAQGAVAGGGAVAFDPVVTAIPDGTNLQAQAVVSADRRFVRLTLVPVLQTIESINDVRTFQAVGVGR